MSQSLHKLEKGKVQPPETNRWKQIESERGVVFPETKLHPKSAHERTKARAKARAAKARRKRARRMARKAALAID